MPGMHEDADQVLLNGPLVLFDGLCNLCSFLVQFLAKRDRQNCLWYASVQSAAGQRVLAANHLPLDQFDSFYFLDAGRLYSKSDAIVRLLPYLGGLWFLLGLFRIMPRACRDWLYDRVARNRYTLFGRRTSCMLPRTEFAARFLD
jgi:predicted DCC family thiol-disulfide oxidoreductase YuxK